MAGLETSPLSHKKVYGIVPPVTVAKACPSDPPKQLTSVFERLAVRGTGSVIVIFWEFSQTELSVTVTPMLPGDKLLIVRDVDPLDQRNR